MGSRARSEAAGSDAASSGRVPVRIAHISDLHHDGSPTRRAAIAEALSEVLRVEPDAVVVSGDLTDDGSRDCFAEVTELLAPLEGTPTIVVPGNRDVRQCLPEGRPAGQLRRAVRSMREVDAHDLVVGDAPSPLEFARWFGAANLVHRTDRLVVVGIDTNRSVPRRVLASAREAFLAAPAGAMRVLVQHHPLLPVPDKKLAGGDITRNAGDLIELAVEAGVDVICSGHHHRSHVASIHWEGTHVQLSMAPMLAVSSDRKHRGYHLIEQVPGGTRIQAIRTDLPAPAPAAGPSHAVR